MVMNAPAEPTSRSRSTRGVVRRITVAVILSGLVFLSLWVMAFNLITSLLIGLGFCAVVLLTSVVSDLIGAVLDLIATIVFGVLAAIAAVVSAIFGLFGN
jgi:hypothetical protein